MPSVLDSLNSALHQVFSENNDVYLLGEDIIDPYGGAFKVSRGLSTSFPNRVLTTPISEAGFTGLAAGMALRGLRPVVEIMFGDFITLIADQLINHITKFRWMYNDQVHLPLVIRTPMGGRRGYGPTHSQTLEKLFLGIPGLRVVAPAAFQHDDGEGSPGALLYKSIINNEDPLIFIENKLQYPLPVLTFQDLKELTLSIIGESTKSKFPTFKLAIKNAPPANLTVAAYGYMADLARQAAVRLAYEYEVFVEVVIPTQLAPFEIEPIIQSSETTGSILVIEEGNKALGWGAEIISGVAEKQISSRTKFQRLAAKDMPVPSSCSLEALILPGIDQIIQAAIQANKSE